MYFFKNIGLLFLFTTLLFTACRKDEDMHGVLPEEEPITTPEVFNNGSFSGVVTDAANQAIENVLVSFGGNSTTTDENGYFVFKNVNINSKGSLVTAEKGGYFYNAKFVSSKLNKRNFTNLKLIEKKLTGTFMADAGGAVATSDGASVEFAANAIKQENGGNYTGSVNVYATWLDPTAADLAQRMPGDLRAINTENQQQQLTTYGMIGVELNGGNGEALNIADGETATIEVPVPSELLGNAPSTIPLWHFDELSGFWVEEGEANLEGDKYVGTVSHFSFWNYDVPNDFVFIEGLIRSNGNNPLVNVTVIITEVSSGMVGYAYPDEDGFYSGAVPIDEELIITIIDGCGEEIYSEPIGPFSEDTEIPLISIIINELFIPVTGNLVGCDNNPVTNGYLKLDFGFRIAILPTDANGNVSQFISICDATSVEVTGFDLDSLRTSGVSTQDITGLDSLNFPFVFVCDDLSEFMIYNVGGVQIVDPTPTGNYFPTDTLGLLGFNPTGAPPTINILVEVDAPGIYTPNSTVVTYFDPVAGQNFQAGCGTTSSADCDGNMSVEITTYEGVGGFVIGSFSGTLDSLTQGGDSQEVFGNFKIFVE